MKKFITMFVIFCFALLPACSDDSKDDSKTSITQTEDEPEPEQEEETGGGEEPEIVPDTMVEDTANWDIQIHSTPGNDDYGKDVAVDSDGNIYVTGIYEESNVWLAKYLPDGSQEWDVKDGSGGSDRGYGVAVDSADDIYVACLWSSSYFAVRKYDSDGNEITIGWPQTISTGTDSSGAQAVAVDSQDNVYAVGTNYNYVDTDTDADWVIAKYESDGTSCTGWPKGFNSSSTNDEHDVHDKAFTVAVDSDDSVYIAGSRYEVDDGSRTSTNWWIKKFASDGIEDTDNWDLNVGNNWDDEVAYAIVVDSNDNIFVGGYGYDRINNDSRRDWWIRKYSSDGVKDDTWADNGDYFYDAEESFDEVHDIAVDPWDRLLITGNFNNKDPEYNDFVVAWLDFDGVEMAQPFVYNSDMYDYGEGIVCFENAVYVAGYGQHLVGDSTGPDIWLKKFDLE